ncbi:MAG: hypothetical protein NVSMB12_20280 [Acidimicrobiales bacterium]
MRGVTRRLGAVVMAGALGALGAVPASHAATTGPDAGWWSRTNVGLPTDPGAPPDVGPTDLFVAGGGGSGTNVNQAVAAVRMTLPAGAGVRSLRLTIKGAAPASVTVKACATSSNWKPVQGGKFADAPTSDCTKSAAGAVVGSDLIFDHVGALLAPGAAVISVVLLPGTADRIVLARPGTGAFDIAPVSAAPDSTPVPADSSASPVATPAPDSSSAPGPPTPPAGELAAGNLAAGDAAAPASGGPDLGAPVASPPAVAAPAPAVPVGAVPTQKLRRPSPSGHTTDDRIRSGAALVVILLLAGYTAIDHQRPKRGPRPLGPFAGAAVVTGPADAGLTTERGIGRFRQARRGHPTRL